MSEDWDKVPIECGMFILDGHQAVPTESMSEWHKCFRNSKKRIVDKTQVGEIFVSTVFLGIDHGYGLNSEGLVFETMVFGPDVPHMTTRYRTWDEAEAGHKKIVEEVKALL